MSRNVICAMRIAPCLSLCCANCVLGSDRQPMRHVEWSIDVMDDPAREKRERDLSLLSHLLLVLTARGSKKIPSARPFHHLLRLSQSAIQAVFHPHLFTNEHGPPSSSHVTLASLAHASLVNPGSDVSSILVWVANTNRPLVITRRTGTQTHRRPSVQTAAGPACPPDC